MHHRHISVSLLLGLVVLTAGFLACSDDDVLGTGDSRVRVALTDAPSDVVKSANVTISRIYLTGNDGGSVDLTPVPPTPVTFDLLDLRNGVEALLADRTVPSGSYGQLRLVVDKAEVTLVDGMTFTDGTSTRTLFVPSGMQSGIKVQLAEPIPADPGRITLVVVDFDVDRNFVLQGNPATSAGLHDIKFTPVLHEKRREETPL